MDGLHPELVRQAPQHIGAQHIVGVPPENARGQAAAVQLHTLQGEGHLIIQQGVGVQHTDVVLLGKQHHRTVAAILVQHIPVRKTLFLELRLLHLAAQHRALPLFGGGQHLAQLPVGPRAAQIHAHHVHGGLHHMEVVVDKPRQHRAAPGVDDLRAGAHQLLPIIAAARGADHFPAAATQSAPPSPHMVTQRPFLMMISAYIASRPPVESRVVLWPYCTPGRAVCPVALCPRRQMYQNVG